LKRGRINLVFRTLLSCAAFAWVLHTTPLHTMTAALSHANVSLVFGGLLLNFLARLAAAERTLVISRGLGLWISRWQTIETLFISNFYALLSPGPVLSGVVTVYRYRGYGASVSASVGSLLASRAIECIVFVGLGAAGVLMDFRISLAAVRYPLQLAGATLSSVCVALLLWWRWHRRWQLRHGRAAGEARAQVDTPSSHGVLTQLRSVQHELMRRGPGLAFQAAVPACVQVILAGAATELLARSVGIDLSLLSAVWITAAVYAVVLLPISIAGVGVREVTLTHALALLGVGASVAVALSILLFLDPLINAMIGGAFQLRSTLTSVQRQA
jgi:uncharacterized membrane protein YbhN (UPF0104 family)